MNLLKETKEILASKGKTIADIEWFGTRLGEMKGDIETLFNFEYDNGFGGAEINANLICVGDGFWLERHEYDGSEWWGYKELPINPFKIIPAQIRED